MILSSIFFLKKIFFSNVHHQESHCPIRIQSVFCLSAKQHLLTKKVETFNSIFTNICTGVHSTQLFQSQSIHAISGQNSETHNCEIRHWFKDTTLSLSQTTHRRLSLVVLSCAIRNPQMQVRAQYAISSDTQQFLLNFICLSFITISNTTQNIPN